MSKTRSSVVLALIGLLASLITFASSGTAVATEAAELRWPAVSARQHSQFSYTDPKGGITLGCNSQATDGSLRTYGPSGQRVRDVAITPESDTCIWHGAVDKNGDVYGYSRDHGDLLAYSSNTLKWRYATSCSPSPTVGADGNIYAAAEPGRLIALSPSVASGQTQPEKVRDVPLDVPVGCGAEFTAFKQGLWTTDQARTFYFYSYGGKKLAQFSPARRPIPTSVNANGLLIYGFEDTVTAFDPMTNAKKWSINLSTLGRTVSVADVYATSDGGAIVQTAGTTPGLIKLNAYGATVRETWSKTFPSVDSEGNEFGAIKVIPNGHGKAVLFRNAKLSTSDPATKVPAVGVAVLDIATGDLSYNKMLEGNLDASSGGLYGLQMTNDPVIGVDTVYVRATCVGVCSDATTKLFPLKVPGMRLDYPRGAVLVANAPMQPSTAPYVAMGDSYSSGEGVEPFEASSATDANKCHRSEYAYAKVISRNPNLAASLDTGKFVACSGATTKHITGAWTADDAEPDKNLDEAPQVDALSADTKIVSLTIGGNDVGFVDFGRACILPSSRCGVGTAAHSTMIRKIDDELPDKLSRVYQGILEKAKASDVYVFGYPQIAPVKTVDDGYDIRCHYLWDGEDEQGRWGDARGARHVVEKLNSKILNVVDQVREMNADYFQRLHFVDVNASDSPFAGHTTCSEPGESYFHNVDQWLNYDAYTLHPNARGQLAYAMLLSERLG